MSAPYFCSRRMMLGGAAAFGLAGCVPIDTSPAGRLAALVLARGAAGTLDI